MDLNIIVEDERNWESKCKRLQTLMKVKESHDVNRENEVLNPSLYEVARKGNVENFINALERTSIEKDLSLAAIFYQLGPSGNSLLHIAVSSRNEEIVELITHHFPSLIFKRNFEGNTALHIAARVGTLNSTEILVCCGKDFPGTEISGSSGNSCNDDRLLRIKNIHGNTALHMAVMSQNHDVVQFLISADPEVRYYQNTSGWSPLYSAVKIGNLQILQLLLQVFGGQGVGVHPLKRLEGNPPAHAAIMEGKMDMLEIMAKENPELMQLRDGKERNPLHWAAYIGNIEAVNFLLLTTKSSCFEMDNRGFLPIHIASERGHVKVIKELLKHWPDPTELLTSQGQNILHLAAKNGKQNMVRFILATPSLEGLLNQKDKDGNAPLHLAALYPHPGVVLTLTWDKRIYLEAINNESLTPFDVYYNCKFKSLPAPSPKIVQILTITALFSSAAATSTNLDLEIHKDKEKISKKINLVTSENLKGFLGTLITVGTLVATVTFSAGFTMPGGYNSPDDPDKGLAAMLNKPMFQLFTICNILAFYCSIMSILFCIYTQFADITLAAKTIVLAGKLFLIALMMMSWAFMAAVHVSVSKLSWLAFLTLIIGICFLVLPFLEFIILVISFSWSNPFARFVSYYISRIMIFLFYNDYYAEFGAENRRGI